MRKEWRVVREKGNNWQIKERAREGNTDMVEREGECGERKGRIVRYRRGRKKYRKNGKGSRTGRKTEKDLPDRLEKGRNKDYRKEGKSRQEGRK